LVIKLPAGKEYLVANRGLYIPKSVNQLRDWLLKPKENTPEAWAKFVFCIAKRISCNAEWQCSDEWTRLEIPKNKHREMNLGVEVVKHLALAGRTKDAVMVLSVFEELLENQFNAWQERLVREVVGARECDVISIVESVGKVEEVSKVEDVQQRIRKERRFIILSPDGVVAWDFLVSNAPVDVTISEIIEALIINEANK
jgi:hypothetical protein